ncbi:MAG: alpha/beta hydrolase [Phormidesmis sp.]
MPRRPINTYFRRLPRTLGFLSGLFLAGLLPALAFPLARPAAGAERVTLSYGFVEISTSVASLREYAESGKVNDELAPYLRFLSAEQRSQFRTVLQAQQNISPVEVSQFLYSSIGGGILRSLGTIVRTQSRRNGAKGLRGALVLAAAEPDGLSALGVIEKFPTDTVRIDSQGVFQAIGGFSELITSTRTALAAIEAQAEPIGALKSASSLPDLAQPGPYGVETQTLTVVDSGRDRTLSVDLYLPMSSSAAVLTRSAPLVIASHGLAGDRRGFAVIGKHLASHGFAVAALDHPGSDRAQFEALLTGSTQEIADPTEFSERPRDVSYLLDELTRLNVANGPLANRLDMEKIGIIGHSFGGYTALALAGAKLDFDTLQANCNSPKLIFNAADPSMLLQCTALEAPEQFSENLRDERIQSVMAMNPITSSVFGPAGFSQLAVPSLLVAGSADPIAPALLEQIRPFIWLSEAQPSIFNDPSNGIELADSSEHYLALIEGGSHLYEALELDNTDVSFANSLVSPDIGLSDRYLKALSLGFMQMTIANNPDYQNAFTSSSIVKLGQPPLPLYVISSLTEEMLRPVPEIATDPAVELSPTESSP